LTNFRSPFSSNFFLKSIYFPQLFLQSPSLSQKFPSINSLLFRPISLCSASFGLSFSRGLFQQSEPVSLMAVAKLSCRSPAVIRNRCSLAQLNKTPTV
jgi:hypothetical protein